MARQNWARSLLPQIMSALLMLPTLAHAQQDKSVTVTPDNFVRAESDMYFANTMKAAGGLGRFDHNRQPMAIENQKVIRANRDTLYSGAVFDLNAGPVTITMPDAGSRFMSLIVIGEDEYIPFVHYGPGSRIITKDDVGTRYALVGIRTLVDPNDPKDIAQVHALQDAIGIDQRGGPGTLDIPVWDPVSQNKVRDALLLLAATLPDSTGMFGAKDQTDPVRHLIGAATGWGGNPERDAKYLTVTPEKNDGSTKYSLRVGEVPVDGFWSVTMYNASGYIEPNPHGVYSLNNIIAKKDADGSVHIQFGGCNGKTLNCLPITKGWNYWVRLYRPREEILTGAWKFPDPQPEN